MKSCASNPNHCNHGTVVECVHITMVLSLVVLEKQMDLLVIMIGHLMTSVNQYHYLVVVDIISHHLHRTSNYKN